MKTLIKTKLLEGKYLELREYEMFKQPLKVIHCESEDYKTCEHYEDKFMFLSVAQQHKGKVVNTLQSKFPPFEYYRMYKFLWKPYQTPIQDSVSLDYQALTGLTQTKGWADLGRKLHSR